MSLRATIFSRCTTGGHAGLSALIGVRCYPDMVPENVGTAKYLRYQLTSDVNAKYRHRGTAPDRTVSRVTFDCYDATGDGVDVLGAQVVAAWDGYSEGCNVGYAFIANRSQTYNVGLERHRQIVDVMIEHAIAL